MANACPPSGLMDIGQVAKRLKCSSRHIARMANAGRMPAPVKLGALIRWSESELDRWIGDGCPVCQKPEGRPCK